MPSSTARRIPLAPTVDACIDGTDPFSRTTGVITFRAEANAAGGTVQLVSETQKSETVELPPKK